MRIKNRLTNELDLVETIPVRGRWDMLMQTFEVSDEYSLEVFRGGRHLGSITPDHTEQRWSWGVLARGDTILKVKLLPCFLDLKGRLSTLDSFTRDYELELQLHVSNPSLFAVLCRHESDPILFVQKETEKILDGYAQQTLHDDMSRVQLGQMVSRYLMPITHELCGVSVNDVHPTLLALDSRHAQVLDMTQQRVVEETRLREEAHRRRLTINYNTPIQRMEDENEVERARLYADNNREQDEVQRQHNRRQDIQDTYARGMNSRIERAFDRGYSPEDIWNDNPVLRNTFGSPQQPRLDTPSTDREPRRLIGSSNRDREEANTELPIPGTFTVREHRKASDGNSDEILEADATPLPPRDSPSSASLRVTRRTDPHGSARIEMPPGAARPQINTRMSNTVYNSHLGLTLAPATFTEDQCRMLELRAATVFIVHTIDPNGPAQRGGILPGDFLIEINNQQIPSAQSIEDILARCEANASVTVRVLRMSQLVDLEDIRL